MASHNAYRQALEDAWAAHEAPRDPDAPTVASLFAGRGGSSLGYSMAGYREVLAADFDAHACATLRENLPHAYVHEGDVSALSVNQALDAAGLAPGELDVLDGSPPCQGFSTAGRRRMGDGRNRLFEQYVRLLEGMRPRAFVVENVSGMVKGKMRLVFVEVLAALEGAGYRVAAQVMNAMHYGVPQSRERVIFIGFREDLGIEPSHPRPTTPRTITVREAIDLLIDPPDAADVDPLLTRYRAIYKHVPQGGSEEDVRGKGKGYNNCRKIKPGRPSPTIVGTLKGGAGFGGMVHPLRPRLLAISEARALASFPDGYRFSEANYKNLFAGIANCVPPLLMRAVAQHIRAELQGVVE